MGSVLSDPLGRPESPRLRREGAGCESVLSSAGQQLRALLGICWDPARQHMASGDTVKAELAPPPEAQGSPQPRGGEGHWAQEARWLGHAIWPEADQVHPQPPPVGKGWGQGGTLQPLFLLGRVGSGGNGQGSPFLEVGTKQHCVTPPACHMALGAGVGYRASEAWRAAAVSKLRNLA